MKLALVFPGQGSQAVGMLAELSTAFTVIRQVFDSASEVLGYDLWQLCQAGPATELNKTEITQPAMLSAGVAAYEVYKKEIGLEVAVMAGHSLGEYSAYVCAKVLDFADAISIVKARGQLMQEAVPEGQGAMAAILGLEDKLIIDICSEVAGVVEAVNFNSPGQVVIAGDRKAVGLACEKAKEQKARRALMLPVSVPSHSSLMRSAADKFSKVLDGIELSQPEIPVINNVNVSAEIEPDLIRAAMTKQLYSPVRWVETIRYMQVAGVSHIIEAGPGRVLSGLNKRIDKELNSYAVHDLKSLEQIRELK